MAYSKESCMARIYSCTLWCDRRGIGRLLGAREVEVFDTTLDLDDSRSVQNALAEAAYRDRGDRADIALYQLEVRVPGHTGLNYRYNSAWLVGDDGMRGAEEGDDLPL
jgi:hypothetical protein